MSVANDALVLHAVIGGALIGLGATVSWLLSGRHIGVAKCVPTFESLTSAAAWWRMLIFIGLPAGGYLAYLFGVRIAEPADAAALRSPVLIVFAGVLAGAGVRILKGCLVGHSVCGLARQSPRSAISVATFLVAAFVTGSLIGKVLS